MQIFRTLITSLAIAVALPGGAAFAADFQKYDKAAFAKAQAEGRSILIDIAAPWCPTCRAQEPIIKSTAADGDFDKMIIYKLDYDTQRKDVKALNARRQSTLIAFKGARETGRLVGDTDAGRISGLMKSALK
jgi:thioredoxin 1